MVGTRKWILGFWLCLVLSCGVWVLVQPSLFTAESIARLLRDYEAHLLLAYLAINLLRGLTLLPGTPLVFAGLILFPGRHWEVLAISMLGILFASTMLYYFSSYLGFAGQLKQRFPRQVERVQEQLEGSRGMLFVFVWAFLPLVSTDVVCCVAGTLRMSFWRFIVAVGAGELILCSIYVFSYLGMPKLL